MCQLNLMCEPCLDHHSNNPTAKEIWDSGEVFNTKWILDIKELLFSVWIILVIFVFSSWLLENIFI